MGKLKVLATIDGYDSVDELLEAAASDSVCTGICTNQGCDYTDAVEPDCHDGWCADCETNTVKSPLILAGMI